VAIGSRLRDEKKRRRKRFDLWVGAWEDTWINRQESGSGKLIDGAKEQDATRERKQEAA
jgi:hypothetical protein